MWMAREAEKMFSKLLGTAAEPLSSIAFRLCRTPQTDMLNGRPLETLWPASAFSTGPMARTLRPMDDASTCAATSFYGNVGKPFSLRGSSG